MELFATCLRFPRAMTNEKYPRTYHFPFSEGAQNDDKVQSDWLGLLDQEIVITEKLDGENTCLKAGGVYARSHGAVNRNPWARNMWPIWERVGNSLGDLHVFGENLYAIHSIEYERLEQHFFVFAIREGDTWLAWDTVVEYAALLDLPLVPELARGQFTPASLQAIITKKQIEGSAFGGLSEGVVCRNAGAFPDAEFPNQVLKFVRHNHVQTDEHWTRHWQRAPLWFERSEP